MDFNLGDKIIYEDTNLNFFKGEIVKTWAEDNEEITAYLVGTETGLYVHFKPDSLEYVRLDESVAGPREFASATMEFE